MCFIIFKWSYRDFIQSYYLSKFPVYSLDHNCHDMPMTSVSQKLLIYYNLCITFALMGEYEKAFNLLPKVRQHVTCMKNLVNIEQSKFPSY